MSSAATFIYASSFSVESAFQMQIDEQQARAERFRTEAETARGAAQREARQRADDARLAAQQLRVAEAALLDSRTKLTAAKAEVEAASREAAALEAELANPRSLARRLAGRVWSGTAGFVVRLPGRTKRVVTRVVRGPPAS
mmetsp:Transcript_7061/g.29406  ORF Transcript_7061/g.29406 Transcript_7061/m.29406 type:complete len:141 (+) Transcript_7061:178-600(+)